MDRGCWVDCSLWRRSWVWGTERVGSLAAGGLEASTEGAFVPQLSKHLGCLKPDREREALRPATWPFRRP